MRRLVAVIVSLAASLAFGGQPALAGDIGHDGADNIVRVDNQADEKSKSRARTSVVQELGPTVANENLAFARSSCVDCRTVAVAVQVILMDGAVTDFRPTNAAIALNEECLRCRTFAFARQEVVRAERRVDLGNEAKDRMKQIRRQMTDVASSESFAQMAVDLDRLTDELVAILEAEVALAGLSAARDSKRHVDERKE